MIEVAIPKDILKFKTTLIGPFTARQTVCISITASVELIYYSLLKQLPVSISLDSSVGMGFLLAMFIMAFGIIEPFGMPLEKYLGNVVLLGILAPKKRVYRTECFLHIRKPKRELKKRVFTSKELKKNPDYIMYL